MYTTFRKKSPAIWEIFQKIFYITLNPVCYTVKWKIDKFVIFISVYLQTFWLWDFLPHEPTIIQPHDSRFKILCPAVLSNRAIIIFYKLKSFKKYFLRVSAISKMSVKRFWIFNYSEIWILYFFVSAAILKIKKGVGTFHHQADLYTYRVYKIWACDLLRRSNFLLPAIFEIFRNS